MSKHLHITNLGFNIGDKSQNLNTSDEHIKGFNIGDKI
jgi:hypothetical protein